MISPHSLEYYRETRQHNQAVHICNALKKEKGYHRRNLLQIGDERQ